MAIDTETMQLIERVVARAVSNATSLKGAADEIAKGVTQYVGARYVPLFAEPLEWDKTKAYEPLTIVLHQGNSYTSRQYVPVGVEIDNDSFWALTGNYNAQVEQYRQEVKALDGRITANANAIEAETTNRTAAVTAEMQRAQGAEQTLQSNIDAEKARAEGAEQTLQSNIDAEKARAEGAEQTLQANIANKQVNEMVVFGDSWTDPSFAFNTAWPFIAGQVNMKLHNYGKSGATFTNALDNNLTSQINTFKADSSFNKSNVAIVYLFGGINDKHNNVSANDLCAKIKELASELKTICPNAQIYYSSNFDYPYTIETDFYWQTVMLGLLNTVNVINVYGLLNASAMNTGDTDESVAWFHPKATGSYELGAFIAQRLTGSTTILNGDFYAGYNYAGVKLTDTSGHNFKLNLLQLWKPDILKTTATYTGIEFLPITEKSIDHLPVGTYKGTVEGRANVLPHAMPSTIHVFKLNARGVNGAHSSLILDIATTRNADTDTWKDDYTVLIEDNPLEHTYITPLEFYIG